MLVWDSRPLENILLYDPYAPPSTYNKGGGCYPYYVLEVVLEVAYLG